MRAERAETHTGFGVAPENWQSFQLFDALGTQWRIIAGFGGVNYEGIDYGVLPVVEKRMGVKRKDRARIFKYLRVMESAAKAVLNAA